VPDDPFPFEPPFGPPCGLVLVGEAVDDEVLVEDGVPGAELVGVAVLVPDGGHGVVGGGGGGGVQPQVVGGGGG